MDGRTLFDIPINDISPNPYNPRLIFEEEDLLELKKSISKVGILVPLTVYRNNKEHPKTPYILLDGERRWKCAKEIGLDSVPANVIDEPKDVTQNILFMFNIHHYRKEWALFPTALKLEFIMDELGTDQESVIADFTGVSRSTIRRCKQLLWYPKVYRNILMDKGNKISTDFFIELYPIANKLSSQQEFDFPDGVERLVNGMIEKFLSDNAITDVKEFRDIRKAMAYYEKSNNFSEFLKKINSFISESSSLEIFASPDIENDMARKNILKYIGLLNANLDNLNPDLISDYYFVDQLLILKNNLDEILTKID